MVESFAAGVPVNPAAAVGAPTPALGGAPGLDTASGGAAVPPDAPSGSGGNVGPGADFPSAIIAPGFDIHALLGQAAHLGGGSAASVPPTDVAPKGDSVAATSGEAPAAGGDSELDRALGRLAAEFLTSLANGATLSDAFAPFAEIARIPVLNGSFAPVPASEEPKRALPFFAWLPAASSASAPNGERLPSSGAQLDTVIRSKPRVEPGPFDAHAVRREFPILEERVHGKRLVWLDNAATTQKPRAVIDRLSHFYEHENSNIHRAAHTLAARATDAYESARATVRRFLSARSVEEIVFTRGATEAINLVAQTYGRANIGPGDEIVITWLEHHANIVPWQMLCAEKGARLRVAPVDERGQILLNEYAKLLGPRTKLVALPQVSNALGTVVPVEEMVALAHRHGARVLVDGAQSVSHRPTNVQLNDADFFVFSGHKVFAPTGIGVLYGKRELLETLPPWQGGGNMIADVTFEQTVYQPPPARFEAGTGSIADAAGLGAALEWLERLGVSNVEHYEHGLLEYATERLRSVPGLRIIGTAAEKAGVVSFVLAGKRTEEVGAALDRDGIAVRSGHHCAQPILRRFGLEATVRASFAPYNTCEDIDALVDALRRLQGAPTIVG